MLIKYTGYADVRLIRPSDLQAYGVEEITEELILPRGEWVEVTDQSGEFLLALEENFQRASEEDLKAMDDEELEVEAHLDQEEDS